MKKNKNYLAILGSVVLIIIMVLFVNEYQYEYQTKDMEFYAEKAGRCTVHNKDEEKCIDNLKNQLEQIGFKEVDVQFKKQGNFYELSLFANLQPTNFDEVLNRKLNPRVVKYNYIGNDARRVFDNSNES